MSPRSGEMDFSAMVNLDDCLYIGPKFGSATITSCPRPSRHRATPSLSVEASTKMRARGRGPNTSANRSASVRTRRSISSPSSVRMQICVSFLWTSRPICSTAGLPLFAASTAHTFCGGDSTPPTFRAGGQPPLHPIYSGEAIQAVQRQASLLGDHARVGIPQQTPPAPHRSRTPRSRRGGRADSGRRHELGAPSGPRDRWEGPAQQTSPASEASC
jgi:hypothetical protein